MIQEDADKNNECEINKEIGWLYEYNEKIYKSYQRYRDDNYTDGPFIEKVLREIIRVKFNKVLNYENTLKVTDQFANAFI